MGYFGIAIALLALEASHFGRIGIGGDSHARGGGGNYDTNSMHIADMLWAQPVEFNFAYLMHGSMEFRS